MTKEKTEPKNTDFVKAGTFMEDGKTYQHYHNPVTGQWKREEIDQ